MSKKKEKTRTFNGTVPGTILGPFLYEVFVSPLFDITPFFAYADDNQIIEIDENLEKLIENMRKAEMITKCLRNSGPKLIYDFLAGNNYPNLLHSQGAMKFVTQISPILN